VTSPVIGYCGYGIITLPAGTLFSDQLMSLTGV